MIDGVLTTCPNCGLDVPAVRDVKQMVQNDALMYVAFKHEECGFVGHMSFGKEWFAEKLAPSLKWFAGGMKGPRPRTPNELLMKEFEIDMEAVESVADMELYWAASKPRVEK